MYLCLTVPINFQLRVVFFECCFHIEIENKNVFKNKKSKEMLLHMHRGWESDAVIFELGLLAPCAG